jgi:hypothetical protein
MGSEILIISIANLFILAYSLVVRVTRFALVKTNVIEAKYGDTYRIHSVLVGILTFLPSTWFLIVISDSYEFVLKFIVVIQLPIVLVTLVVLMPPSAWRNLTSLARRTRL